MKPNVIQLAAASRRNLLLFFIFLDWFVIACCCVLSFLLLIDSVFLKKIIVPTFVTKVTEYSCSDGFFSSDKLRFLNTEFLYLIQKVLLSSA